MNFMICVINSCHYIGSRNTLTTTTTMATAFSLSTSFPKSPPSRPQSLLPIHQPPLFHHRSIATTTSLAAISSSQGFGSPGVVTQSTVDALDEVRVLSLDGNSIPISDLWKDRRSVVAFARHFGCVLCRKRADYLAAKKDQMDAAGVALVLIGPGNIDQARAFSEQTKFKGEVYADPDHSSYDALEFVSGLSTIFTPKAGLKIVQVYMEGYRQDWELSLQKHTVERGGWQQGGIIVAGPGKSNILYVHKDKEAGDDPPIDDVLKACCA